jgi:hypothetical protein
LWPSGGLYTAGGLNVKVGWSFFRSLLDVILFDEKPWSVIKYQITNFEEGVKIMPLEQFKWNDEEFEEVKKIAKQPDWRQYVEDFWSAEVGTQFTVGPDGDDDNRKRKVQFTKAAESVGKGVVHKKIRNKKTDEIIWVAEVVAKPVKRPAKNPTGTGKRGRPRRNAGAGGQ